MRPVFPGLGWDDLDLVPELAHEEGMRAYLYVSLYDEGWRLPRAGERERSYHSEGPGRYLAWQSEFSRRHPEYAVSDRSGRRRQWGVLCLAYPQVRAHFRRRIERLLKNRAWDGFFVCLRSQSRPADHADQFGYNEAVMKEYRRKHGDRFELRRWRDLLGESLTGLLRELRAIVPRLAVGVPRGDILGARRGNGSSRC